MKRTLLAALALVIALAARAEAQHSPSHHAAALELLTVMHIPEALQASQATALRAQVQANPQLRGVEGVLRDFFARYLSWDMLKDPYAELYANTFTEAELREMTAFYRTPVGQKLARSSPALMRQGADLGDHIVQQHMSELQEMIRRQLETGGRP
jgi:hypothetical protein